MSQSVSIAQVLQWLESKAPAGTAESWDNVGLLAGDPAWKTTGAVVSVDLTREALETALSKKWNLIVNHHPCLFPKGKGLGRIVPSEDEALNTLIFEAIRNGVAIVSSHTNFDRCALEVVEQVSKGLGARAMGRLFEKSERTALVKLSVFVPEEHLEAVRAAVSDAGAGHVGRYDSCSFSTTGEGTFRGSKDTRPFIGKAGQLEKTKEARFETVFPRGLEQPVLRALFNAHPYEEIAYDLYAVEQKPADLGLVKGLGYGFWGEIDETPRFSDFLARVTKTFDLQGLLMTGKEPKNVSRVAFVAGKGAGFVSHAAALECDVMITGEAGYHTALDHARSGMAILELGHRESEHFFPEVLSHWLTQSDLQLKTKALQSSYQRFIC